MAILARPKRGIQLFGYTVERCIMARALPSLCSPNSGQVVPKISLLVTSSRQEASLVISSKSNHFYGVSCWVILPGVATTLSRDQ